MVLLTIIYDSSKRDSSSRRIFNILHKESNPFVEHGTAIPSETSMPLSESP
jgi:hypothetical protein